MNDFAHSLCRAIPFSATVHAGQFDRAGRPYILHPLWVMRKVAHYGDDFAILGVCHDNIEDGYKANFEQGFAEFAVQVSFDKGLIGDLRLLTHDPAVPYGEYIRRIAASPRAAKIKATDLRHNSDITRLKGITDKDLARVRKYHACYLYLTGQTDKLFEGLEL